MKLKDVFGRYLSYIKRQHSNGTYRFYQSHLGHFEKWLIKRGIFYSEDLKYFIFDDYMSEMKDHCENVTINKRIGILKRCFKQSGIDLPYLQSIEKLRERSKTFEALEFEQFKRIRKYIREYPECTTNGIFYKCFLTLLADTGARIKEIMAIEIKNINLVDCEILLTQTKTKEDRIVFFTPGNIDIIKKMIAIKHDHKFLLHNIDKNRAANYDDIRYILRQAKSRLNIKKLHPHMFRHTVATYLIESGMDLPSLMDILGHRNLETTRRYLHVSKKHVKTNYQKMMDKIK